MAAVTLLTTRGLERNFGGLKAVAGVDFALEAGEIRAVIGPNGAGKTTFVSLVSGRIPPSAGTITFDGRDVTDMPAFRRVRLGIAYTFQITSVYARLPVAENVALAARPGLGPGASGADVARRVDETLARVGLSSRRDQPAGTLAYGHQRLLEVAMGLALSPRLIILDEPTQGLSDAEIDGFVDLVRAIVRDSTVMLIEHNMAVVMALAHRITVLDRGRILAEGTPDEIRADDRVQKAYLGT
jgi:branched-chain amino acid transport system ATP-binding protein